MRNTFTKMKVSFLIMFLFLLATPLTSAEADFTFQYNRDIDLKIPCFNNGSYCGSSYECNATITYPDSAILINNRVMTYKGSFRNLTILREDVNQLGVYKMIESCCDAVGNCGAETFDIEVTADGKTFRVFPQQFVIIIIGFIMIGSGIMIERLRLFKHAGSVIILIMGVLTLYPGYAFINWTTLMGKGIGFTFVGLGFYFLIEDSFSRNKQEENYQSQNKEYELVDDDTDDGRLHR